MYSTLASLPAALGLNLGSADIFLFNSKFVNRIEIEPI